MLSTFLLSCRRNHQSITLNVDDSSMAYSGSWPQASCLIVRIFASVQDQNTSLILPLSPFIHIRSQSQWQFVMKQVSDLLYFFRTAVTLSVDGACASVVCRHCFIVHDDVIKWKHFPRCWPFVWGIRRSLVNSPHKGQWHGALMFSLICVCINGWVNNFKAGDLRRHRAHYDVIVMIYGTALFTEPMLTLILWIVPVTI